MASVSFLLALPTVMTDLRAPQHVYTLYNPIMTLQPSFDHSVASVRAATPPTSRVLIVDPYTDAQHFMVYRCQYLLYPREVVLQRILRADLHNGCGPAGDRLIGPFLSHAEDRTIVAGTRIQAQGFSHTGAAWPSQC